MFSRYISRALCAVLFAGVASQGWAQQYPQKPIHILVGYPAGGTSDSQIRALQEPLGKILGQPVIVENKSGASGSIATVEVARSKPDGYTLLLPTNIFVIAPNLQRHVGFDPIRDFAPISLTSLTPLILLTSKSVPAKSLAELIRLAKAKPDSLTYGTAGTSSYGRMATILMSHQAGIKMREIPYQGVAPSTTALASGEIDVLLSSPTATISSFVQDKRINLLGVAAAAGESSNVKGPLLQDTLPGFHASVWSGLVAPAGTPESIVKKLSDAVQQALSMPEVKQRYARIGLVPASGTPEEFAERLKREYKDWQHLIEENHLQTD